MKQLHNEILLPKKIQNHIKDRAFSVDQTGMSDSQVICFDDMILKISKSSEESGREAAMLSYLAGKLPVPKCICFETMQDMDYLLMSKARGEMTCDDTYMEKPQILTEVLAEGLKMLWKVDIKDCSCGATLDWKLKAARSRVESGLCVIENPEGIVYGENSWKNPVELLEWLENHRPKEQLVFSHGDFCLPNIFAEGKTVTCFIDLGRAGISDPYQDIAICWRSLKYNYAGMFSDKKYPPYNPDSLFEALGIEPDREKMQYYILLDELF